MANETKKKTAKNADNPEMKVKCRVVGDPIEVGSALCGAGAEVSLPVSKAEFFEGRGQVKILG